MKIDVNTLRPVRGGEVKMADPIRFPNTIEPMEKETKDSYKLQMNKMLIDITKSLVKNRR